MLSRHRLRRAALTGAILVSAAGALITPGFAQAAAKPIALGVNLDNAPGSAASLQSYTSLVSRNPAIVMWYQQWSEPLFYSTQLPHTAAIGAIPMITWDPSLNGTGIAFKDITAGKYDSYVKSQATAAAAWKQPIYIRFAHEMNLGDSPFGPGQHGNTAASFVSAWHHVVNIFRQQGATNVEWVWSPNVDCGGKCPFTSFYPGSNYVDWVALDGYNYASVDHVAWESFDQVFGQSYAELTSISSKPMMIAETGSTENGGNKAQWITQSFMTELPKYPHIHAVVWFDRNKETDWRVNSSPAALAAWQQVVASPQYAGTAATLMSLTPTSSDASSRAVATPASAALARTTLRPTTAGRAKKARKHKKHHGRHRRHRHHRRHARRRTHGRRRG